MMTLEEFEARIEEEARLMAAVETVRGYVETRYGLRLCENLALSAVREPTWMLAGYNDLLLSRRDILAIAEGINAKQ